MPRETVVNKIVTKHDFNNVIPENKQLMYDFLDYLKAVDRSTNTIHQYENDLKIFFCYNLVYNDNKKFVEITKRDFMKFQSHALNEWKWSSSRLRRVKACISSLSNYIECILDEEPEFTGYHSIIHKIESPILKPRREKTILSDNEINIVLDTLVKNEQYQCACIFALAAFSGARRSELLRFKVHYFDDENIMENAALYRTPEKIVTKGRGSSGKSLYKYTLLDFKKYYDLWINERRKRGIESEMLFVNKNGLPLSKASLTDFAKDITDILNKPFYFHSLRHQLCTRLFKLGLPADVIQEYFGWDSLDMTSIYNDNDVTDSFGKYFTKEGIKGV